MVAYGTYYFCMSSQTRVLEVVSLDDLDPKILPRVIEFFNSEYPGVSSKLMGEEFFRSKIKNLGLSQTGYLTVAMFGDQVVGTCSAIRKELQHNGNIIQVVEIGDTFTSMQFRRDCHFRELYPGTKSIDDYLNKSIFGRLVSETLDRSSKDGAELVYGVPNQQAKLSYIGRLNFDLVDGDSTYRISSPTLTHPSINRNIIRRSLYRLYHRLSLLISFFVTRKYQIECIEDLDNFNEYSFLPVSEMYSDNLQLRNTGSWIETRFILNSDKKYEIIQINSKKSREICGYYLFLVQSRDDGFRLLLNSKELIVKQEVAKYNLPISRIVAHKFFEVENLSMWIDLKITPLFQRFIFGYPSKPAKVEIVAKNLTSEILNQNSKVRFYNFQYGDSDLG